MRIYRPLIVGLAITYTPADSIRASGHTPETIAEIVTFKLNDDIDDAAFVKAAKATEPFVMDAPGFIARRLSQGSDGTWTDYILWSDMASAMAAAKAVMAEPSFAPFMGAIAPDSVVMRHEPVAWSMTR